MRIAGKVVLITGGSEGIGAATAEVFRRRGAWLALAARSKEKLEAAGGPEALCIASDLKDQAARDRAVTATIERFGRLDILINNAGVGLYAPSWRAPIEQVREMFELNLFAALAMIQLAVPHLKRAGGGMIVNVGSIAGLVPLPWFTLYSASKFALSALGDGLRIELKSDGIHVLTVCPGYVRTGFQQHVLAGRPPDALFRARRFAITPEQCAEAIARGVERDARTVVTPGVGRLLTGLRFLFPRQVDRQLERIYRTLDFS